MAFRPRSENIFDNFGQNSINSYDFDMEFGMPQQGSMYDPYNDFDGGFEFGKATPESPYDYDQGLDFGASQTQNRLQQIGDAGTPKGPNIGVQDFDMDAWMNRFTPATEATTRFNQLIDKYPERERPGLGRTIVASIAGLTNPEASMKMLEAPNIRNLADWKNRIEPAQQAANLERQENVNERQFLYQSGLLERDRLKQQTNEENTRIRQQRMDLDNFKAKNPDLEIKEVRGGNLIAFNPATGTQTPVTGMDGKPIPSGLMSQEELANLNSRNRIDQIKEQGMQGQIRDWLNAGYTLEQIMQRGDVQAYLKGVPSADSGVTSTLPSQQKVQEYLRARKLYNENPELRDFIILGEPGTNGFELDLEPRSSLFGPPSGPTPEQIDQIINTIYPPTAAGDTTQSQRPAVRTPGSTPNPAPPPNQFSLPGGSTGGNITPYTPQQAPPSQSPLFGGGPDLTKPTGTNRQPSPFPSYTGPITEAMKISAAEQMRGWINGKTGLPVMATDANIELAIRDGRVKVQ